MCQPTLDEAESHRTAVAPVEARGGRLRTVLVAGKILVSLGLLAAVAAAGELGAIGDLVLRLQPLAALAAVLLLAGIALVSGLRWWLVGRAIAAPLALRDCISLMFVGIFFSQVLPTSIGGDAVRILYAGRRGLPYGRAFSGVMLERIGGLLALVLMVAGGALWLGERIDPPLLRLALIAALPGLLVVLAMLCCLDLMPLPRGLLRVGRPFFALAADARKVLLAPLGSLILLALSVLSHLLTVGAVFVLAIGLGVGLEFSAALAAVPAIVLITFIPLSFAGWGLREGAAVVMLGFVGLAPEEAVALSVLLGVATLIAGLPGLAFWLGGGGRGRT
ncbi:lysylphosphatidylglycerol synthase transmembrane domain-containing protein [Pelagibius sp. 7325]|uniref:lysylphosphatidylglycerol synthase transmembrane domain-containing protein n=1 Tax=Pelagibius sp. 7325 TaxID=3131994 RepID=UPI0030EB85F2